ncbi:MAG: hypothetical protein R2739_00105 [Chitinophagales bacterium]|nr:hypothetical protein [Bacteroidota bacterium]
MDTNQINFNELWSKQESTPPDIKELSKKIHSFKRKNILRIILTNVVLAGTIAFIIFVWMHYQPQLLTTKIGIILTVLAMVIYIIVTNNTISLFKKTTTVASNQEYLQNLLAIKQKQQFINTTIMKIYFILLSIGIGLYMIEYASRMSFWGAIVTYAITFAWILFNWIYTRPRKIKKQEQKMNEIISKLEEIQSQLKQE